MVSVDRTAAIAAVLFCAVSFVAAATPNYWIGNDGKWSQAAGWSLGVVPTASHDVYITQGTGFQGTATLFIDSLAVTCASLTIGNGSDPHHTVRTVVLFGAVLNSNPLPPGSTRTINVLGGVTVTGGNLVQFTDLPNSENVHGDDPTLIVQLRVGASFTLAGGAAYQQVRPNTNLYVNCSTPVQATPAPVPTAIDASGGGITVTSADDFHSSSLLLGSGTIWSSAIRLTGASILTSAITNYPLNLNNPTLIPFGVLTVENGATIAFPNLAFGRSAMVQLFTGAQVTDTLTGQTNFPTFLSLAWSTAPVAGNLALDASLPVGGFDFSACAPTPGALSGCALYVSRAAGFSITVPRWVGESARLKLVFGTTATGAPGTTVIPAMRLSFIGDALLPSCGAQPPGLFNVSGLLARSGQQMLIVPSGLLVLAGSCTVTVGVALNSLGDPFTIQIARPPAGFDDTTPLMVLPQPFDMSAIVSYTVTDGKFVVVGRSLSEGAAGGATRIGPGTISLFGATVDFQIPGGSNSICYIAAVVKCAPGVVFPLSRCIPETESTNPLVWDVASTDIISTIAFYITEQFILINTKGARGVGQDDVTITITQDTTQFGANAGVIVTGALQWRNPLSPLTVYGDVVIRSVPGVGSGLYNAALNVLPHPITGFGGRLMIGDPNQATGADTFGLFVVPNPVFVPPTYIMNTLTYRVLTVVGTLKFAPAAGSVACQNCSTYHYVKQATAVAPLLDTGASVIGTGQLVVAMNSPSDFVIWYPTLTIAGTGGQMNLSSGAFVYSATNNQHFQIDGSGSDPASGIAVGMTVNDAATYYAGAWNAAAEFSTEPQNTGGVMVQHGAFLRITARANSGIPGANPTASPFTVFRAHELRATDTSRVVIELNPSQPIVAPGTKIRVSIFEGPPASATATGITVRGGYGAAFYSPAVAAGAAGLVTLPIGYYTLLNGNPPPVVWFVGFSSPATSGIVVSANFSVGLGLEVLYFPLAGPSTAFVPPAPTGGNGGDSTGSHAPNGGGGDGKNGLSPGAAAGVAVVSIVFIGAIGFGFYRYVNRAKPANDVGSSSGGSALSSASVPLTDAHYTSLN